MEDFKEIQVIRPQNRKKGDPLIIKNPTNLKLLGQGAQGAVFKLSEHRCVKIYGKEEHAKKEREALKMVKGLPFAPKIYNTGENYIVMEYLGGMSLDKYLRDKKEMPLFITKQILTMFKQFKQAGFKRVDPRIRHLFLTNKKTIKAIDHVNAHLDNPPYPERLLMDLKKIKLHKSFLNQVKRLEPERYKQWKKVYPG